MRINRQALRVIRERSRMTQKDLARAIGSSAGYIHDLENGRRRPSPATVHKLAEALACPLPALLLSETAEAASA